MRTTRKIGALWTLAAAALASLATVLALPARQRRRHRRPARPTRRSRGSADRRTVGSTLTASQGTGPGRRRATRTSGCAVAEGGGLPSGADCAAIGGATTTKYVVATADVDHRLRVRVTASNADGSKTVASNASGLVRAADAGKPVSVQAPTLSGTAAQGQTLHVTPGTWNGAAADHVHLPLAAV